MITEDYLEELDMLFKIAVGNLDILNDWENSFVLDFVETIAKHGTNLRISDKQQYVIDKIESKLEKAGVL